MKIYCAHPISGLSYEEVVNYYVNTYNILKPYGYDVLYPMIGKAYLRNEIQFKAEGYKHPLSTNHAIFQRDKWMVHQADIVFADLTNTKIVSIGTLMEIAIASDNNKNVVICMEETNIHRHAFVLEAASVVFNTYTESIEYLKKLINREI